MKNYEELTQDLLTRRDRYVAEQKKRRKAAVTSLCCVSIVALLGFGLWKSGLFRAAPPAGNPSILSTGAPTTPPLPGTVPTTNAPIEVIWVVNKVDNTLAAAKLNYNTPEYYSEKKDTAALTEYFGRDFSALGNVMPEGFQYVKYAPTFFYKNDGTAAYDSCNFLYRKGDAQISIRASKIGVPYDYIYKIDNPVPSNINGVEMIIGEFHSNNAAEKTDLVFADFSHNGIQYRVTVTNVPFDGGKDAPMWLVEILAELIA